MIELSLHLLDLLQNSAHAGATRVGVRIIEDDGTDSLTITVSDNGRGMDESLVKKALDPFYSSLGKRTGLGLPMVAQAAQMAGGTVSITSKVGIGTEVTITFAMSHVDRQPLGDVAGSVVSFLAGNTGCDVSFQYRGPSGEFRLDTAEIKEQAPAPLSQIEFLILVEEGIRDGLARAGFRPDKGGLTGEEH